MRALKGCVLSRDWRTLGASWLVIACAGNASRPHQDFVQVHKWLICDECIHGERAAVSNIGDRAVGKLDSALIGPSPQRRALMRAKLSDSFRFAHSPGADSNAYISPRLANYVATYQKRAATSLGDIGTPAAIAALERASRDAGLRGYRSDVIGVIELARNRVRAPRFGGRVTPTQLSFGEIVSVIAPPGRHFNPQNQAAIAGSPFRPDQIPFARVGDTLRFPAVADAGTHTVVVTDLLTHDNAVGSVTITSLQDATDRAMVGCNAADTACIVANAPRLLDTLPVSSATGVILPRVGPMASLGRRSAPFAVFLALSRLPPRPDTIDFLKLEPLDTLPVTAVLDWHGPANLNLVWRKCAPFIPVPNVAVASFALAESTSVVIPARECWILQVSMGPGGNGPALARLRVRSP